MIVTILIPTNNRPQFLREALESVARQSAVKAIDCVWVSDNGEIGDDRAAGVCEEFQDHLNIYYRQQLPCSAHEHGKALLEEYLDLPRSKYTAILHDDDWWTPGHLATALHALEATPNATFYGSCHFDVRGPNSMLYCTHNFYAWFGANFASLNCAWVVPPENAVLTSILGCFCHYSTMVMRTEAFKEASSIYHEPDADFDNDRRLQFALSQMGQVIYNPMPMVFTRHHENRDCVVNFTDDERTRHMRLTTQWIAERFDIKALLDRFCVHYDACPRGFKNNAAQYLSNEWVLPELQRMMKKKGIAYENELPGLMKVVPIA